jgi:FkbM family methyltransferase
MVKLEVQWQPTNTCQTDFYVNAIGGIDIAVVSRAGIIMDRGVSRELEVDTNDDGSLTVCALYESHDDCATFGSYRNGGVYTGSGTPQYVIKGVRIHVQTGSWFDHLNLPGKITLIDVGAAGGIQDKWSRFMDRVHCVIFEPAGTEAAELREQYAEHDDVEVMEVALSDTDGIQNLYLTRFPQCSSLLKPRHAGVAQYKVAPCFDVVSTTRITVCRYETLWLERRVPRPEVIKIDVQGAEYQVLKGFGGLLNGCLGIELETHFYQIYEGQQLIGDLVAYLENYGLFLRKLEQQSSFDADLVEVNAYFIRRRKLLTSSGQDKKLQIIEHVWGLRQESSAGAHLAIKYGVGYN